MSTLVTMGINIQISMRRPNSTYYIGFWKFVLQANWKLDHIGRA